MKDPISWFFGGLVREIQHWIALLVIIAAIAIGYHYFESHGLISKPYLGRWRTDATFDGVKIGDIYDVFAADGRCYEDGPLLKVSGVYTEEAPGRLHIQINGLSRFLGSERYTYEVDGDSLKLTDDDGKVRYFDRANQQTNSNTQQAQEVSSGNENKNDGASQGNSGQDENFTVAGIPLDPEGGPPLLNVRTGPGANFPSLGKLPEGYNQIHIIGTQFNGTTEWAHITSERYSGWVNKKYLKSE
jgi:hypothetical protein